MPEFSTTPQLKGASVQREGESHKTRCSQSNNPNGHNRECKCGWWRKKQAERFEPVFITPLEAELHTFFGLGD